MCSPESLGGMIRRVARCWRGFLLGWALAVSALSSAAPVDISSLPRDQRVTPALEVREDPGGTLALADLLAPSAFQAASRLAFARCDCAIWTRFSVTNPDTQFRQVIVINTWPYVDYLDMYAVHAEGRVEEYLLGGSRRDLPDRILHRYEVQPLLLAPGATVDVITRHASANAINIGVELLSPAHFMAYLQRDAQVWGIFTGLVFVLMIYSSIVGFSLQKAPFLIYVAHASLLYLFTIFLLGESIVAWLALIVPAWEDALSFVSSALAAHLSRMLTTGVMITGVGFARAYFDLRTKQPRVARLASAWIAVAACLMVMEFVSIFLPAFDLPATLLLYLLPCFLLSWLAFAVFTVWQKLSGGRLYLAGTGSFVLLSLLQDAYWFGLDIDLPDLLGTYGVPLGFMLELVFLGLALGVKVRRLKEEHDRSQELILEQARFSSVGQLVSEVVHQLKRPVIYAGTQLMKLEALAEKPPGEWKEALPRELAELRKTIDFMDRTIVDLYHFYAIDEDRKVFSPAEQIEQALRIITPMTTGSALRIERTLLPEAKVYGHAHAFAHALLIVLENAAQVLKDRQIASPCIGLVMQQTGTTLQILITDNAGGIRTNPPDRILESGYSRRAQPGMGIGLAIARRIIEEKLQGRISVRNHDGGALFTIELLLANEDSASL